MADISEIIEFTSTNLRAIEDQKNVAFSSFTKTFFESALIESLAKTKLSLYTNSDVTQELDKTFDAIRNSIESYQVSQFEKRRVITIEDFMEIIHLNWCGVYPFCKSLKK